MELDESKMKELMGKHLFELTEEELVAIASLLTIKISSYKKGGWFVKFRMTHQTRTVFVQCSERSNLAMGRSDRIKNGESSMVSFGGCFSFASAVKVFRGFYLHGYELNLTIDTGNLIMAANDLVEAA